MVKNSKLKLVGKLPATKLHLGATAPSPDIKPGDYIAKCTDAWTEFKFKKWRVVWQFQLYEGAHRGVGLRKWKSFEASGEVAPGSEYVRACELALGRPLTIHDDLDDPRNMFADKIFIVRVGFRKTDTSRGGIASDENSLRKKDSDDTLRVHEILSLQNF